MIEDSRSSRKGLLVEDIPFAALTGGFRLASRIRAAVQAAKAPADRPGDE